MTLAHNDAFPYYIWPQKVISFRRYHPGKQSMTFWTFAVTLILTLNTAKHTFHKTLGNCGPWWCITLRSSVIKVSAVQKVPSGQTLHWILNHYCDHDFLHNNSTFSKYVLAYDGLPTKFGKKNKKKTHQFRRYYSIDIVETVILWLYKPLLWPWPWK